MTTARSPLRLDLMVPFSFSYDFETYTPGTQLNQTNDWPSSPTGSATVVTNDYTWSGAYPMPVSGHTQVAALEGGKLNHAFWQTADKKNVWVDSMIQFRVTDDLAAIGFSEDTLPQVSVAVNTNGELAIYHSVFNGTYSNVWTGCDRTDIQDGEWARLILELSYANPAQSRSCFRVTLNDDGPLTNAAGYLNRSDADPSAAGTWFLCANQDTVNPYISEVTFAGGGMFDDVVISPHRRAPGMDADSDGDGMGDIWETTYGFDPASVNDGNLDTDNDGQSDLIEARTGMDPTNSQSLFMLSEVGIQPDSQGQIKWLSATNKIYDVEYTSNLVDAVWSPLASGIEGTPPVNSLDVNMEEEPKRFYRILLDEGI